MGFPVPMALTTTIYARRSPEQIHESIRELPAILSGERSDRYGIARTFWTEVVRHLFHKISEAFAIKADGGTDELGNRWKDISLATKAARRMSVAERKRLGVGKHRGLLTAAQDKMWRGIFHSEMKRQDKLGNGGGKEAKEAAAKLAWAILKSRGAKTRRDVATLRKVKILRDTDRLYKSFLPSQAKGTYRPKKDQVFDVKPGQMEFGSSVEYAEEQDRERPIIPPNYDKWLDEAFDKATQAVIPILVRLA